MSLSGKNGMHVVSQPIRIPGVPKYSFSAGKLVSPHDRAFHDRVSYVRAFRDRARHDRAFRDRASYVRASHVSAFHARGNKA